MLRGLEGWHIVLIVGVAVVLFGSGKLPGAARSMGQSLRIFKSEMKASVKDETPASQIPEPQAVENKVVTQTVTDSVPQSATVQK